MLNIKRLTTKMNENVTKARWAFDCRNWEPTEREWTHMASGLTAEEKVEVGKFVFKEDAKSAMVGRFLIKKFVTETSNLGWDTIRICRESHGKPYLEGDLTVKFNISHGGDFVVLAGEAPAAELALGVDVARVDHNRSPDFLRLMWRQLAPAERKLLDDQPSHNARLTAFFRLWCLKESYTKATGTGLTVDLSAIAFLPRSPVPLGCDTCVDDTLVSIGDQPLSDWTFEESMLDEDHVVTVASRRPPPPPNARPVRTFCFLTFEELVSRCKQVSELDLAYGREFVAKKQKPS